MINTFLLSHIYSHLKIIESSLFCFMISKFSNIFKVFSTLLLNLVNYQSTKLTGFISDSLKLKLELISSKSFSENSFPFTVQTSTYFIGTASTNKTFFSTKSLKSWNTKLCINLLLDFEFPHDRRVKLTFFFFVFGLKDATRY